jgi:CheY-specific phosphatase CheX
MLSPMLTETTIEAAVKAAVPNVCKLTLMREALFEEALFSDASADLSLGVIGSVTFSGHANGVFYLGLPLDFAREMTSIILGISVAEVDYEGPEVLKDAICEVSNMVTGGFRNVLSTHGVSCRLSPPVLSRGNALRIPPNPNGTRHGFRFGCGGYSFIAEVHLRAG